MKTILIIGAEPAANQLYSLLAPHIEQGYQLYSYFQDLEHKPLVQLTTIISERNPSLVIVALTNFDWQNCEKEIALSAFLTDQKIPSIFLLPQSSAVHNLIAQTEGNKLGIWYLMKFPKSEETKYLWNIIKDRITILAASAV